MADRPSLAARIRAAVQRKDEAAREAAREEAERKRRVEQAVATLLDELEALGKAAGLTVKRKGSLVRLSLPGRFVAFERVGDQEQPDRIAVSGTDLAAAVEARWQERVNAWALRVRPHGADGKPRSPAQSLPLKDQGLEWLLARALELDLG